MNRGELPLSGIGEGLQMGSAGHLVWLLQRQRESRLEQASVLTIDTLGAGAVLNQ